MTAALAARRRGLETVLLEKSAYFGGSTARSGGGVWIPGNYALREAGQADPPEASKRYLDAIVGDVVPEGPPRHLRRPRPRGHGLHQGEHPAPLRVGARVRRLPPRAARRAGPRAQRRAGADEREVPRRRARPAAPAVHQGAGQPDRHPGRLPQDQPGPALPARPADDAQGDGQPAGQHRAGPQDVRDGQRARHRAAQGPDRRRRAGALRDRADRPGDRGRPRRRRPASSSAARSAWSAPAAA